VSTTPIPGRATVLLDTPAFVYHAEDHPRHYAAADALFERLRTGDLQGYASALVLTELLVPYYRGGDAATARALASTVHAFPNLTLVPVSGRIADRAAELRARHGLHTPDAVHVATAIEHGAAWLVTNDHRLRRVETEGIRVWLFDEAASNDS
jgi:predicted nucleic acid-binding protein